MRLTLGGKASGGAGCLILFGIPFAGVGAVMLYLAVSTIWTWVDMRQWVDVPATILHAELETNSDSDGTTYRATARYRYTYQGREYESDRVAIGSSADNVGAFQQDAHRELSRHADSGDPFPCFVNPDEPSQAVLYRRLRPEMLMMFAAFGLVFGGVGVGVIVLGVRGRKTVLNENRLRDLYPEEPWRWNEAWAEGTVKSTTKTAALVAAAFAMFWNAIAIPIAALILPQALREGEYAALLVLLFPAVGLGLFAWAALALVRWRKYGESVFQMTSLPGVVGGPLAGVIYTNVNLRPEEGFKLTLNCIRRRTTGSGKNRSTHESVLWQDARVMQRELLEHDTSQSAIPVLFTIPFDAHDTDEEDPNNRVFWRLEAEAAVPGVDYNAQFEVPVFKTPESRPDFVADEAPVAQYQAPVDQEQDLRAAGILRVPLVSGGCRYDFPMARLKGTAAAMTLFLAIWIGAIVFMTLAGAPFFMIAIFALFGLLIGYFVLDLWFGSERIEANFQVLTLSGSILGIGRKRTLYFADIESIEADRGMQAGTKLFYQIKVKTAAGKTYTAAKRIPDRRQAEAIAADLTKALSGQ